MPRPSFEEIMDFQKDRHLSGRRATPGLIDRWRRLMIPGTARHWPKLRVDAFLRAMRVVGIRS